MEIDDFIRDLDAEMDVICAKVKELVREGVEAPPPGAQSLTPINVLKNQAALQAEEGFHKLQKSIDKGYRVIFDVLTEKQIPERDEILSWCAEHLKELPLFFDPEHAAEALDLEVPEKHLDLMYRATSYLYNNQRFDEALDAISVCTSLNPKAYRVWYLSGMILQGKNQHDEALFTFQIASEIDNQDPYLQAAVARSWIGLKQWEEAKQACDKTIALCQNQGGPEELEDYCKTLTAFIESHKAQKA